MRKVNRISRCCYYIIEEDNHMKYIIKIIAINGDEITVKDLYYNWANDEWKPARTAEPFEDRHNDYIEGRTIYKLTEEEAFLEAL